MIGGGSATPSGQVAGCGRSAPAMRMVPAPSASSPIVVRFGSALALGAEVADVADVRPPAAVQAAFATEYCRANEEFAPSSFWIANPSGVGSKVCRRLPVLNLAPGWATPCVSGSASSTAGEVDGNETWPT